MNGSEKQIKWAEDIKAGKAAEFAALRRGVKHEFGTKALDYIEHNDNAKFWIDHRDVKVTSMLNNLLRGGLQIKGYEYKDRAVMNTTTGEIVVTQDYGMPR